MIHNKTAYPWNIHRVNLSVLPLLDTSHPSKLEWLNTHLSVAFSDRERAIRAEKIKTDVFTNLKDSFHSIFIRFIGLQGPKFRVFALGNDGNSIDTLLFVNDIRFDVSSHTVVADSCVLPLTHQIMDKIMTSLERVHNSGKLVHVKMFGDEQRAWKQILPVFAERCRQWKHTPQCEYLIQGRVPLSVEDEAIPLCNCGRGKDIGAFRKVKEWEEFAPYVTRIALAPLFAVSYLESVGGDVGAVAAAKFGQRESTAASSGAGPGASGRCKNCGGAGKPKILVCGSCRKVGYCSPACQKEDWKLHKVQCKNM
jgi:hypothetical protein